MSGFALRIMGQAVQENDGGRDRGRGRVDWLVGWKWIPSGVGVRKGDVLMSNIMVGGDCLAHVMLSSSDTLQL